MLRPLYHFKTGSAIFNLKQMIDPIFQTVPGFNPLSAEEQAMLISKYSDFLHCLTTQKLSNLKIEPYFQSKILEYFKTSKVKFQLQNANGKIKETSINPLGEYRLFGVSINRSSNKYLSDYDLSRKGRDLFYLERVKDNINNAESESKSQSLVKNIAEEVMAKENKEAQKENHVLINILKKVLPEPKSNVNNISPRNIWKRLTSKGYTHVSTYEEDHIVIEDFQIISHIGIILLDSNGQMVEEKIDEETGGFCHYIRTEREVFGKSAPSIDKIKNRRIIDFDGFMSGNPACLIKRFDLINQKPI